MIYKFIDINGSEISVNSISSLQALVDSETIKESTKVKAGLRGKWTLASEIEELIFAKDEIEEPEETQAPQGDIKSFITKEEKTEEAPPETKSEEVTTQPWQNNKVDKKSETLVEENDFNTEEQELSNAPVEEKSRYELEEERRDKTYDDENVIGLNFFDSVIICFKKYFNFNDRASLSEFWYFQLFLTIIVILNLVIIPELLIIPILLFSIPSISVTVRRLHDRNKSGLFYFWSFFPFIGSIIVLVNCLEKGTEGKNQYGEYPLKLK